MGLRPEMCDARGMASASRPTSAFLVPIALVALGTLDLGAALMHGSNAASVTASLAMAAYVATAFGGAVEWTAAALIVMRRTLGRRLYVTLMPVRIVIAATAALLAYGAPSDPGSAALDFHAAALGLGLDIAIYVVLTFAMFRPVFAGWLSGIQPTVATASAERPRESTAVRALVTHPAAHIAAFIAVLLFTVFVLEAPLALLWAGAAAIVLMLGVRAYLQRR